jgi:Citrate transporter
MPTEVADAAAAAVAIAVAIAVHRFRKATRSAHLGDPPLNVSWLVAVLPILLLYLRPDESSAKSYGIVVVSIAFLLAHATLVLPYRSVMVMLWVLGSLEDPEIITHSEGEMGIITVMILSFVAEGICRTGALDYYMGLVLGNPKTVSGAQIRLMIPVAILSAFLYNSPIVVAMIPITIRWAIKIGVPHQQLLLPLSCAAFLGGACTLVGTSTNLILSNLLEKRYPNEASANFGLFGLAVYGVPNMMIGLAYILVCSPFLLRMGKGRNKNSHNMVGSGDGILLGALVECWSPVAGRTYKQSGLGNSNDVFLISVRRATTGYIHTAISEDFVFSVGDELYFSGLVEMYGYFGVKYGLSLIAAQYPTDGDAALPPMLWPQSQSTDEVARVGVKEMELVRRIHLMYDQIGGQVPVDLQSSRPAEIIVTPDETGQAILVGVDCQNRPRLIAKIEDILSTQVGLIIFYSDVKVFGKRSVSVWGCKLGGKSNASPNQDFERIADAVERISDAISSLLRSSDQALPLHPRYTYRTTPEMRRRGLEELRFMHFFWEQFDLYTTSCYAFGVGTALQKSGVAKGVATLLVNVGMSLGVGGKYPPSQSALTSRYHRRLTFVCPSTPFFRCWSVLCRLLCQQSLEWPRRQHQCNCHTHVSHRYGDR